MVSDDPDWVSILGWQGRLENERGLFIDQLDRVGPGHYRSTQPIPVWGSWKTLLRVQDGHTMTAVPIWEPADDAIPARRGARAGAIDPAVRPGDHHPAARARPERPGLAVHRRLDLVLIFTLMVIAGLTWGAGRINNAASQPEPVEEKQPLPRAA